MREPNAPSRKPRPSASLHVAALVLLLATVPACFMVNYGEFMGTGDGGPDGSAALDGDGPGSIEDGEASPTEPDAAESDVDGSTPPDAASPDDGASIDAPDADSAQTDAAQRDAGTDASTDAGRDAGMDAGDAGVAEAGADAASDANDMDVSDTAVVPDSAIDTGDATLPCPAAGCTQTCPAGTLCPFVCAAGTACRFDCRMSSLGCNVTCQTGSVCEVLSDVGGQDTVSCQAEARCGRVCDDAKNCSFAPCTGGSAGFFFTCELNVNRCNWVCP